MPTIDIHLIKALNCNNLLDENIISEVISLYKDVGWFTNDSEQSILTAINNSYCTFGAFDKNKLVGIFRAISDGVSDAYLIDLVVSPAYRNLGIANRLTETIVAYLKSKKIEWITCISTPEAIKVYSKFATPMQDHLPFKF